MEVKLWAGELHQGASFVASLEEERPAHLMEEMHVAALDRRSRRWLPGQCCRSHAEPATGCVSRQAPVATALLPFTWHSPDMGPTAELPRSQMLNTAGLEGANKTVLQPWHPIFPKSGVLLHTHGRRGSYLLVMWMLCRLRVGKSWFLIPALLLVSFSSPGHGL